MPLPLINASNYRVRDPSPGITGAKDMSALYQALLQNQKSQAELPYAGPKAAEDLSKQQLANQLSKVQLPYAGAEKQAGIDLKKATATYYNNGGPGMGVSNKNLAEYHSNVLKDNPHLRPDQVREALGVVASGGDQLADGTKLNPPSLETLASYDFVAKNRTTAPLYTQRLQGDQAEAEISVLDNYARKALEPYKNTFSGYSPEQIMQTFKTDPQSQKQLGRFIASQALQYEIAQNRIKLAGGQPGVSSTEELMKLSGQQIKGRFPRLSQAAREEASSYLNEALKKGNEARKQVGINISRGLQRNSKKSHADMTDEELRKRLEELS